MNPGETQTIEDLLARALGPYEARPDAEGVACLIDDLITAGQGLHASAAEIPAGLRTARAGSFLAEWTDVTGAGPLDSDDHANWNHARGLARILDNLVAALRDDPAGRVAEWCEWHNGPADGPTAMCWGPSDSGPGTAVEACQGCRVSRSLTPYPPLTG